MQMQDAMCPVMVLEGRSRNAGESGALLWASQNF